MDELDPSSTEASSLELGLDDRLTALELRHAANDRGRQQQANRGRIALGLALVGATLAAATAVLGSPFTLLFSFAATFALLGLGYRTLAAVNGMAAVAGLLIAVLFVPALHAFNHRTQQAVNNLLLTATSSQPIGGAVPTFAAFDGPLTFPTYGPIDVDIDGGGAVLPGP